MMNDRVRESLALLADEHEAVEKKLTDLRSDLKNENSYVIKETLYSRVTHLMHSLTVIESARLGLLVDQDKDQAPESSKLEILSEKRDERLSR